MFPALALRSLLLMLLCAAFALPVTAAHATPRPAAPAGAAAHQDADDGDWSDDDGDDDYTDPVTVTTDDGSTADDGTTVDDDDPAADDSDDWGDDDGDDLGDDDPVGLPGGLPVPKPVKLVTTATVSGKVAMLRKGGKAAIPRSAPLRVRRVIAAANRIVGKPYKWGGGHAKLEDRGYDCSGTVGYSLIRAGLLTTPMVSGTFAKWGRAGAGKWITIYANKGHVYMEVAGLRLDTSPMGDTAGDGPRWRPAIGKRKGFHVRHIAGL